MKQWILATLALGLMALQPALAAPITWTDWTSATTGASGSAAGTMGGVSVRYSGDVAFAQLGTGTNYWTEGSPAPYTGNAVVDNAPTAAELIAMERSGITNTVSFSSTVMNPIMAIVSQGRTSRPVTYDFDTPFSVLSEGRGYFGDGFYQLFAGDMLKGYELHGVIQFSGAVNSVSWVADPAEYWHGFTMGMARSAEVPEPGTFALLAGGLMVLSLRRRRSL